MTFTIGSVASGAGMHLHGLKAIGGVPTWAIEMDEAIAHCYTQNHGGKIHIKKVEDVPVEDLEEVDLLIATLSCKNASISKGANRGELQADIAAAMAVRAIIKAKKPKYFMLENVWLYRSFEGFGFIRAALEELGYYSRFYKFNLRDWRIAQSRDRLYLLASRDSSFPDPVAPKGKEIGWYEAIADLIDHLPQTTLAPWQQKKFPELMESVNSCLIRDCNSDRATLVPPDKPALTVLSTCQSFRALIKRVGGGRDSDRLYQQNEPAFTIRAVGRNSDHHSRIADAVVGDKVVAISPRACLRFFGDKETADNIWLPPTKSLACEVVGNGASWVMFRKLFECLSGGQSIVNGQQSMVNSQTDNNSSPFRVGERVRILEGQHQGKTATVHEVGKQICCWVDGEFYFHFSPKHLELVEEQAPPSTIDIESIADELIKEPVSSRFRSYLVEYLHEAYGLRSSNLQPDLTCFVNAQANTYAYAGKSEKNNIAGDVQLCAIRANKGTIREVLPDCKNINFSDSRVLFDSGAFPEVIANCRVTPEKSLQRQLEAIALLPKFKETWLVSYDRLIDEKHINGTRVKQRWSVEEGESAVAETVEAAKYLDSQRDRLQDYTLVQSCQGVDAPQYLRCVKQVLEYCRPGDVVGLGGWCILGRQASYLQTFWETINLVVPAIARAGITKVHIFGVTWYKPRKNQPLPPLQPLLWLCDQYGIELSTDGRSPIANALWKDITRSGATFPYWRHNLAWVKAEFACLRDSPLYQAPPGWESREEELSTPANHPSIEIGQRFAVTPGITNECEVIAIDGDKYRIRWGLKGEEQEVNTTFFERMKLVMIAKNDIKPGVEIVDQHGGVGIVEENLGFGFAVAWSDGEEIAYNWERDSEVIQQLELAPEKHLSKKEQLQKQFAEIQAQLAKYQECEENAEFIKQQVADQAKLMLELEWKQSEIVDWGDRLYFLITGIDLREERKRAAQTQQELDKAFTKCGELLIDQGAKEERDRLSTELEKANQERESLLARIEMLQLDAGRSPAAEFSKGDKVITEMGEEGEITGFAYGNAIVKLNNGELQFRLETIKKRPEEIPTPINPEAEAQRRGQEFIAGIKKQSDVEAIAWPQIQEVCQGDVVVLKEIYLGARTKTQKSLIDYIPKLLASHIEESGDGCANPFGERSDLDWVGSTLKAKVEELLAPKQPTDGTPPILEKLPA